MIELLAFFHISFLRTYLIIVDLNLVIEVQKDPAETYHIIIFALWQDS